MPIKTLNTDELAQQAGTLYEAVVVMSKRSRQVASNVKAELDDKLSYFEGFENEIEDLRMAEEQAKVSLEYEKRPKPTEVAIDEMQEHEVFFRYPAEDSERPLF
ncbi:MAG: DNA-directed RNA polymerase subunit omega [Bacteroidota bacterium]